jgi:hypothetical protein
MAVFFAMPLISLPTYMSGYSAQKSLRGVQRVSQDVISSSSALRALRADFHGRRWHRRVVRAVALTTPCVMGPRLTAAAVLLSVVTLGLDGRRGERRQRNPSPGDLERPAGCDFDRRDPCAAVALERIHHEVSVQPSMGVEDARNDSLHGFVPALRCVSSSRTLRLLGWMRNAPLVVLSSAVCRGASGASSPSPPPPPSVTARMVCSSSPRHFSTLEQSAFHLRCLCMLLAGADVLFP